MSLLYMYMCSSNKQNFGQETGFLQLQLTVFGWGGKNLTCIFPKLLLLAYNGCETMEPQPITS